MNRINSQDLWEFVNGLGTYEKVKFKVFHDDMYVTEIYWDGYMFEWEEGTLTSEAFFNPLYDFVEIIEDDERIEKIKNETIESVNQDIHKYNLGNNLKHTMKKVNELIDHINKIEEKLDER